MQGWHRTDCVSVNSHGLTSICRGWAAFGVWRQSEKYGAASGVHLETFRNVRDPVDGSSWNPWWGSYPTWWLGGARYIWRNHECVWSTTTTRTTTRSYRYASRRETYTSGWVWSLSVRRETNISDRLSITRWMFIFYRRAYLYAITHGRRCPVLTFSTNWRWQ